MDRLRIAITGRTGQVVSALRERASALGLDVIPLGRPDLDLARPETVGPALRAANPDAIVNAAAYTAVDAAEAEAALAFQINAVGAGAVAEAAAELAVPIVHLSTDYVFDGAAARPYREDDPTGPLGVYGRSKLAGEQAVARVCADHAILRTAWVYSPFGSNFVKTMLRLAATRDVVSVVADQHGAPTSALDLADGIAAVVRTLLARPDDNAVRGVFHMTGQGETTWADFARAIFTEAAALRGPSATVTAIATADYPTAARRPMNSRLDCARIAAVYDVVLPPWPVSLRGCVSRLIGAPLA